MRLEKLGVSTVMAIVIAFAGLALALDPRGGNLTVAGVLLALGAAVGLGVVIAVSSRVIRAGDLRRVTLYMAGVAGTLLIVLCAARGAFAWPQTAVGWIGFASTAVFYAFAIIAFFIALSMIGPTRVSLLSYAEPMITAGLGVMMLQEALELRQAAGIVLVVVALVAATASRRRQASASTDFP